MSFFVCRQGEMLANFPTIDGALDYLRLTGWSRARVGPNIKLSRVEDGKPVSKLFVDINAAAKMYADLGYNIRRSDSYAAYFIPFLKGVPQGMYQSAHHFFSTKEWSNSIVNNSYEVFNKNVSQGVFQKLEVAFVVLLGWKGWSFVYCDRSEAIDNAPKPLLITRDGNYVSLVASLEDFFASAAAKTEGVVSVSGAAPKLIMTLDAGKTFSGTPEAIFAAFFGKRLWKVTPISRGGPIFGIGASPEHRP